MSRTLFKFSMPPDGATRRVMFQTTPSWNELAAKIESLYDIPVRTLAVAYIDSDGDEVTLSSEEELQDYYKFNAPSTPPGALAGNDALKAIRFTVRNLSAARDSEADKPLPQTPLSSNHRNTFGTNGFNGMVFDNDDDWQRIQRFAIPHDVFVPYSAESDDAPHAFVELLESDVSGTKELTDKDTASTISDSDYDALKVDKGKGKENVETIPDDDVSRVFVVEERSPDKHPVHVRLTSQASTEDIFGAHKSSEVPLSIPEETDSTPMALDGADNSNNAPDPPLPEFDDIPATTPAPSLANDVAGLFNTFSSIFASHPELSESLQNIARNASSGAYWAAHRAAIERAAQEVRHSAAQAAGEAQRGAEQGVEELRRATEEAHRAAEEAAGRRVTEAIGNVLRTIGQYTGFAGPEAQAADEPVTSTPVRDDTTPFPQRRQQPFRRETWHSWAPPRGGMFNGFPGRSSHSRGGFTTPIPPHLYGPPLPPAPPPAPPFPPGYLPPHGPPPMNTFPFVPPPPPLPMQHVGPWAHHHASTWAYPQRARRSSDASIPDADVTMYGVAQRDSVQTAREQLQTAKDAYKAEKERYRREREARKADRQRRINTSGESFGTIAAERNNDADMQVDTVTKKADENVVDASGSITLGVNVAAPPAPDKSIPPQIASNARGGYPQLEVFPVPTPSPRRHHTMHGLGHRHHGPPPPPPHFVGPPPGMHMHHGGPPPIHGRPERGRNPFQTPPRSGNPGAQVIENVTRRLADMGFTAATYPSLPSKVNARVARGGGVGPLRQDEDAAVTDVLDQLLAEPVRASASGSGAGLRRSQTTAGTVPGAWQ